MKSTLIKTNILLGLGLVAISGCREMNHSAFAQQAPQPIFTLNFSNGSTAANAQGQNIPARVDGKFSLQDSPHGKAMVSGPGAAVLYFPTKGIINPQSGTVEMWVCPLDWSGAETKFHTFFDVTGQGALNLQKQYVNGFLLMMASSNPKGGPNWYAHANIADWKPGQWHFVVGTWSPSQVAIYVDGQLTGTDEKPGLPSDLSGEFEIGDDARKSPGAPRTSQSLISGVRIYDRALAPAYIAAHYAGNFDATVPLSAKVLSLNVVHDINTHQWNVMLGLNGAGVNLEKTQVDFLLQQNGKTVQQQTVSQIINGTAQVNFSSANLTTGTYQVVADVATGTQHAQISQDVEVPDLSWLGNKLGEEDKVPAPWTPMTTKKTADGADISCWGRTYQFDGAPLPTQIVSQDQPMLARPVELKVLSGGKPLQWQNGNIKVLESSPTHVVLQGSANADTAAGKVLLTTNIRLSYDGLAMLSIHLQKPAGWQPESMSLEIPVRPQNAIYYHHDGSRVDVPRDSPTGLVPTKNGVADTTTYQPFSWLGDDTRGLFWFCQTAQFWSNWRNRNALQIVRSDVAVTIQANLLKGQTLPNDWDYSCGIEATPVKAIPADWRKWRLPHANGNNVDIMWDANTPIQTNVIKVEKPFKYFGFPEVANDVEFAAAIKKIHDAGIAEVPYSCLTFMSDAIPAYQWYEKQWDIGIHGGMGISRKIYHSSFNAVSTGQPSLQDFLVWNNVQFVKKFHLDGLYQDQTMPYSSTKADAGYGWQDGDTRQITYGITGNRELYRRLYAAVKDVNPNAFLFAHMSGKLCIPYLAYDDAILQGEQFRNVVKDSYMDVMSLAEWRAVFTGRQWGVPVYFLPEFEDKYAQEVAPTRGLAALTMLHDVPVWSVRVNMDVWNKMQDALDKFGYEKSTFIPYWSPQPPASTDMKDVYISAYKIDNRALVVVGNTSREPRSGTVTLNEKSLGLPVGKVLSWPDGKPLPDQNGKVQISMDGQDYRLLLVGTPPAK